MTLNNEKVDKEAAEKDPNHAGIVLAEIDCKDLDVAVQCVRLTGQFTVPQVFFNSEYVGNCRKIKCLDRCGVLRSRLHDIAGSTFDQNFPPRPEGTIIKLTKDVAVSDQPTFAQLRNLSTMGFRAVISVREQNESGALAEEEAVVTSSSSPSFSTAQSSSSSTSVKSDPAVAFYSVPFPLGDRSNQSLRTAAEAFFKQLDELTGSAQRTPVLVHGGDGKRACILVLMWSLRRAAKVKSAGASTTANRHREPDYIIRACERLGHKLLIRGESCVEQEGSEEEEHKGKEGAGPCKHEEKGSVPLNIFEMRRMESERLVAFLRDWYA